MTADDETEHIFNVITWLAGDVAVRLWSRGWSVVDPDVSDDEPLEWYWPPTAQSPWLRPTTIIATRRGWRVQFGRATAQEPDSPVEYVTDQELERALPTIEWWPMPPKEALRIQADRVFELMNQHAFNLHSRPTPMMQPYEGQIEELRRHLRYDAARRNGDTSAVRPTEPRPDGDLPTRIRLLEAQAWASAVRSARAGGASGPI